MISFWGRCGVGLCAGERFGARSYLYKLFGVAGSHQEMSVLWYSLHECISQLNLDLDTVPVGANLYNLQGYGLLFWI